MIGILFLLFVGVPLAELYLLLKFAAWTSPAETFALVIFTGVVGASLARWQGRKTLERIQGELAAQRMPSQSLLDAGMILVAGMLLLTPGIMTDVLGFSLLVPPCRRIYQKLLLRAFKHRFRMETFPSPGARWQSGSRGESDPNVIDSYVVDKSESEDHES